MCIVVSYGSKVERSSRKFVGGQSVMDKMMLWKLLSGLGSGFLFGGIGIVSGVVSGEGIDSGYYSGGEVLDVFFVGESSGVDFTV